MNANDFRELALGFDDAEEGAHMGAADFRVGGRIFATLAHGHLGLGNLMLSPELQKSLGGEGSAHGARSVLILLTLAPDGGVVKGESLPRLPRGALPWISP